MTSALLKAVLGPSQHRCRQVCHLCQLSCFCKEAITERGTSHVFLFLLWLLSSHTRQRRSSDHVLYVAWETPVGLLEQFADPLLLVGPHAGVSWEGATETRLKVEETAAKLPSVAVSICSLDLLSTLPPTRRHSFEFSQTPGSWRQTYRIHLSFSVQFSVKNSRHKMGYLASTIFISL